MAKPASEKITIAIVEDESLYRDLLVEALSTVPVFEVVGAFADGETALRTILTQPPSVAVLDVQLSGALSGIQVGLTVKARMPDTGVVWLSNHAEPYFAVALGRQVTAGWAYLLKKSVSSATALARAIEGAARGLVVLDIGLVKDGSKEIAGGLDQLTPRQRGILALMAEGITNAAIAEALHLTEKSVENQINQMYQRLEIDRQGTSVQPRVSAVLKFLKAAAL